MRIKTGREETRLTLYRKTFVSSSIFFQWNQLDVIDFVSNDDDGDRHDHVPFLDGQKAELDCSTGRLVLFLCSDGRRSLLLQLESGKPYWRHLPAHRDRLDCQAFCV
jgi:hypothetical protein